MKKIFLTLLLLVGLTCSSSVFAEVRVDSTLADTLPSQLKSTSLLFVVLAKQGKIQLTDEQSQQYTLTLQHANPKVIYFANRPVRASGQLPLDKFIQQWTQGSFNKEPPNAVMEAVRLDLVDRPSKSVSYAVVLRDPVYNVKKNELSFKIKGLPGNKLALPTIARSDYVALFIDNDPVCLTCVGS